jgi:hypothetical protein
VARVAIRANHAQAAWPCPATAVRMAHKLLTLAERKQTLDRLADQAQVLDQGF